MAFGQHREESKKEVRKSYKLNKRALVAFLLEGCRADLAALIGQIDGEECARAAGVVP